MLSKLMRCTKNCNTCSQHWLTRRAQLSTTTPDHMSHNQHVGSWTNWATKFALSAIFTWLLANDYHFFKHLNNFCRENTSTTSRRQKNTFQEFFESWGMDFYATGIQKLISHWQKRVDCNVLINKDVFEPSYDLKFTIQNHNYTCTNLIFQLYFNKI